MERGPPTPQQPLKTGALGTGRCPKSHSWGRAEIGFEHRAPASERAEEGKVLSRSPCAPRPHFSFLPRYSEHRKPGWGLPCPFCLQPGGHGVLASPAATPGLPLPVLRKTRRPPCGKGRLLWRMGGCVDGGMGASQAGSLTAVTSSRPGPGPCPFLLLQFPQSSCNLERKAGGPRMGRHLVPEEQAWALTIMERFLTSNDSSNSNGFCLLGGFNVALSHLHPFI